MNEVLQNMIIKETIEGFDVEYLVGYRPTDDQIQWLKSLEKESSGDTFGKI